MRGTINDDDNDAMFAAKHYCLFRSFTLCQMYWAGDKQLYFCLACHKITVEIQLIPQPGQPANFEIQIEC